MGKFKKTGIFFALYCILAASYVQVHSSTFREPTIRQVEPRTNLNYLATLQEGHRADDPNDRYTYFYHQTIKDQKAFLCGGDNLLGFYPVPCEKLRYDYSIEYVKEGQFLMTAVQKPTKPGCKRAVWTIDQDRKLTNTEIGNCKDPPKPWYSEATRQAGDIIGLAFISAILFPPVVCEDLLNSFK